MRFQIRTGSPANRLPEGFLYVGQDNVYVANLNAPDPRSPVRYLYSDSATSCIIVVVEGKDAAGNPLVALAHLSRTDRFLAFFALVAGTFVGPVNVFAQGANPPQPAVKAGVATYTSLQNEQTVIQWVQANTYIPPATGPSQPPAWFIQQSTLSLGLGDPNQDDRGCYGIDLGTMTVSNQAFGLTPLQRDPTGGVQTLFCVFGLQASPPIVLQPATQSFTEEQIAALVALANQAGWTSILYMTAGEVLDKYSSTPQYEAPWFYETLRMSAAFVRDYNNPSR